MRQWTRAPLTFANVTSLIALFVALGGGAYAATGGNFILGKANSAGSRTSLSAPIADKALQLTNASTGAGATALGLNVASGHPPFTVNSGAKVANLNADKLDGIDSGGLVSSSSLRRVGPVTVSVAPDQSKFVPVATIGNLSFRGYCAHNAAQDEVDSYISSAVNHSAYASLTQAGAGGTFGNADMTLEIQPLALVAAAAGTPSFTPISGSAVEPGGKQVVFNLYQAMNARNQPTQCMFGECMFGGSFVVK